MDTVNGRLACFIGGLMIGSGLFGMVVTTVVTPKGVVVDAALTVSVVFFLAGSIISALGVRALDLVDKELRSMKLNTLFCPHCDMKLKELQSPIPSGDTHQCTKCGRLYAPYGR